MPLISFAPFYSPSHPSIHLSIYYMCNSYLSIRKEIAFCTTTVILLYKGLLLITVLQIYFMNHRTIKITVDSSDFTGTCRDDNSTVEGIDPWRGDGDTLPKMHWSIETLSSLLKVYWQLVPDGRDGLWLFLICTFQSAKLGVNKKL